MDSPQTNEERWRYVYDMSEQVLLEIDEERAKNPEDGMEPVLRYMEQRFGRLLMIAQDALGDEEMIRMVSG